MRHIHCWCMAAPPTHVVINITTFLQLNPECVIKSREIWAAILICIISFLEIRYQVKKMKTQLSKLVISEKVNATLDVDSTPTVVWFPAHAMLINHYQSYICRTGSTMLSRCSIHGRNITVPWQSMWCRVDLYHASCNKLHCLKCIPFIITAVKYPCYSEET